MESANRERLEALRGSYEKLTREKITNIGWRYLEETIINGKKYIPSMWVDTYQEKLLLVVQLQRKLFLPFVKQTDCIGSLISLDGEITHVDERYLMNELGHP